MFVVAVITVSSALALPQVLAGADRFTTAGAARYMAGRLQRARMQAVSRSANIALRFTRSDGPVRYAVYQDGNGNGVLSADIDRGTDVLVAPAERLADNFAGVEFGALPDLPPVDSSGTAPGGDPLRIGSADMVSFSALGTSTAGTLYIRGRSAQYAVRIFGETGKTRILEFNAAARTWRPQ